MIPKRLQATFRGGGNFLGIDPTPVSDIGKLMGSYKRVVKLTVLEKAQYLPPVVGYRGPYTDFYVYRYGDNKLSLLQFLYELVYRGLDLTSAIEEFPYVDWAGAYEVFTMLDIDANEPWSDYSCDAEVFAKQLKLRYRSMFPLMYTNEKLNAECEPFFVLDAVQKKAIEPLDRDGFNEAAEKILSMSDTAYLRFMSRENEVCRLKMISKANSGTHLPRLKKEREEKFRLWKLEEEAKMKRKREIKEAKKREKELKAKEELLKAEKKKREEEEKFLAMRATFDIKFDTLTDDYGAVMKHMLCSDSFSVVYNPVFLLNDISTIVFQDLPVADYDNVYAVSGVPVVSEIPWFVLDTTSTALSMSKVVAFDTLPFITNEENKVFDPDDPLFFMLGSFSYRVDFVEVRCGVDEVEDFLKWRLSTYFSLQNVLEEHSSFISGIFFLCYANRIFLGFVRKHVYKRFTFDEVDFGELTKFSVPWFLFDANVAGTYVPNSLVLDNGELRFLKLFQAFCFNDDDVDWGGGSSALNSFVAFMFDGLFWDALDGHQIIAMNELCSYGSVSYMDATMRANFWWFLSGWMVH